MATQSPRGCRYPRVSCNKWYTTPMTSTHRSSRAPNTRRVNLLRDPKPYRDTHRFQPNSALIARHTRVWGFHRDKVLRWLLTQEIARGEDVALQSSDPIR